MSFLPKIKKLFNDVKAKCRCKCCIKIETHEGNKQDGKEIDKDFDHIKNVTIKNSPVIFTQKLEITESKLMKLVKKDENDEKK